METQIFNFKGINRHHSDHDVEDGWCDELINLRHKNGKLQRVGVKEKLYNLPANDYAKIWVHVLDEQTNYIGLTGGGSLEYFNEGTGAVIQTIASSIDADSELTVLKRFIVTNSVDSTNIFLFRNSAYVYFDLSLVANCITVEFSSGALTTIKSGTTSTEQATNAESLKGKYYEYVNSHSTDGYVTGSVMLRVAIKLFDGSYIFHTLPYYVQAANLGTYIKKVNPKYSFAFESGKITANAYFYPELFGENIAFDDLTKIISSICIFATKAEPLYDISKVDDDDLTTWLPGTSATKFLGDVLPVADGFQKLQESTSFYKVGNVVLSSMIPAQIGLGYYSVVDMDWKGFYQNYATRETLPVDNFTWHKLFGQIAYNYNSRLILGNTRQRFGNSRINIRMGTGAKYQFWTGTAYETYEGGDYDSEGLYAIVSIDSTQGVKKVVFQIYTYSVLFKSGTAIKACIINSLSGYPDYRASSLDFWLKYSGAYYKIGTKSLFPDSTNNFAYIKETTFDASNTAITFDTTTGVELLFTAHHKKSVDSNYNGLVLPFILQSLTPENNLPTSDNEILDSNRVQMSELDNPFIFPSKYSYQVGTGAITNIAANTEPISTGQFGEYPLQIFTEKGIWAMSQGDGDVLFSAIIPVSGDIAIKNGVLGLSAGVVFRTADKLFLLRGKEVTEISVLVDGAPNYFMQTDSYLNVFLNDVRLCQIAYAMSGIEFNQYLDGAIIGFDKYNNELIVSNYERTWSYVFNFESGFWYKINRRIYGLINNYPELYSKEIDGIYNLSSESDTGANKTLLITRPIKLGTHGFKTIYRSVLRSYLRHESGTYLGFYVYASNDAKTWQFVTGRNSVTGDSVDQLLSRLPSMAKYYIFVVASDCLTKSYICSLEVDFNIKLGGKVR